MPTTNTAAIKKKAETLDKDDTRWCTFWEAYPRGEGKQNARLAWLKLAPSDELVEIICAAVERLKSSSQWIRGFVPHASTFLNGRRWEDVVDDKNAPQSNVAMITRFGEDRKLPLARRPKKHDTKDPT